MSDTILNGASIVFDLDGTLIDTAPDLTHALNDVLTRRGHASVPAETIRSTVAFGARAMIEEGLRRAGASDDVDRMLEEFLAHYEANIASESRPFPGAVAALDRLAEAGARLAICTNKREDLTRKLLTALGLLTRFDAIAGRDTFGHCKPDPRHLTEAIELAGGSPARAIMVGDSEVDIRTAEAAAIPVIAVTFGYGAVSGETLKPTALIDRFDALIPCAKVILGVEADIAPPT